MSAGCIRERGPGRFEVRYEVPRGVDGQRRTRTETVRGSKRAAQRRLRELLGQVDRGVAADAGKMTVGRWLEEWLAECRHTVSPKTHQERAGYIRLHLAPALGVIPLARLAPADVQNYLTRALTSGRLNGKGGLAPQTVHHHERVLHTALERARRLRLIAVNPCDDVDPPRVEHAPIVTLSTAQQTALLAAVHGTNLHVPVLVALATGLRRGELLGLAWPHVDLRAGLLRVVQTIEETKAGVRVKAQPKTAHGRRTVALTPGTVEVLRAHLAAQVDRSELLFPTGRSAPRCSAPRSPAMPLRRNRVLPSRSPPHPRH